PGPLVADLPKARLHTVFRRLSILTLNDREGATLTGETGPVRILKALVHLLPPSSMVILRLGDEGALVGCGELPTLRVPARSTTARDTTGAGDVHTAALLAGFARGSTLRDAVREANAAASWAVEREGPSQSPSRAELDRLLADWT
ncbi:MAG: carbohydrate kinase family protein, partial [Clostridia bacterium]